MDQDIFCGFTDELKFLDFKQSQRRSFKRIVFITGFAEFIANSTLIGFPVYVSKKTKKLQILKRDVSL